MDFYGVEAHSFSAYGTGIVCDEVTTRKDPGSVLFFLPRVDRAHDTCIGNSLAFGNLLLADKERLKEVSDPYDPLSGCSFKTVRIVSKIGPPPKIIFYFCL